MIINTLVVLFWLLAGLIVYIYIGYPLLAAAVGNIRRRSVFQDDCFEPSVSVLIAAYNEAEDIEATLRNKLAQSYPRNRMEILVISDESTDGTDDIVKRVAADTDIPIRLVRQIPRQGKTAGLNCLVPDATGDILLFSDANSQWAPDAIQKLVRNFADPDVGYVTGKMVYTQDDGFVMGDGCSAYMKYENWLRKQETRIGSVVGVDGGIDAMRKTLYAPLNPDQLPDFVQPLKVVEKGARVVYEPEAILKEPALNDAESEFAMRVRVSLRALWALKDMRQLLNPLAHGLFAVQLWSHKVLRYYAYIPLTLVLVFSLLLASHGPLYNIALWAQVAFYGLACIGQTHRVPAKAAAIATVPYYFTLLNFACYRASLAFWKGERKVTWSPRKG